MAYTYKVYGSKQVDDAVNMYNNIANNAPKYTEICQVRYKNV